LQPLRHCCRPLPSPLVAGAAAAPPAHPLLVRPNGRVVVLSSINGIAGAFGQTNYATTKAALIG